MDQKEKQKLSWGSNPESFQLVLEDSDYWATESQQELFANFRLSPCKLSVLFRNCNEVTRIAQVYKHTATSD